MNEEIEEKPLIEKVSRLSCAVDDMLRTDVKALYEQYQGENKEAYLNILMSSLANAADILFIIFQELKEGDNEQS